MKKKRLLRKAIQLRVLLALAIGLLALVLLYRGGRWLEHRNEKAASRGDHTQRYAYDELIQIDDATYRGKKNITTILLMGIDREGAQVTQSYRNGGQADFLRLIVLDSETKTVSQVGIDRDTMTPITVLGVMGNRSGVRTAQISLSHGFGDGKEQSCELTLEAVSNLLMGVPIDFYVAVNMDGISVLNDSVGGVTVTLEDDFAMLDPAMTPGKTMTLVGDQAEYFVRNRKDIGVGNNASRMKRQEQYLSQLGELIDEHAGKDKDFVGKLYDSLTPYMITNIGRGRLINEVWNSKEYEHGEPLSIDGVHAVAEDGFMQFHADEASIRQIVLDLFYEKVDQ